MTTAAIAIVTATTVAATSVSRAWKLRLAKGVPNSSHGVDQPRLAVRLELAAQVGHIDLQRIGAGTEIVTPDLLEDPRAAEDDPRVAHEELQQPELGPGQLQVALAATHVHGLQVEDHVGELEDGLGGRRHRAPQERPETGQQLV